MANNPKKNLWLSGRGHKSLRDKPEAECEAKALSMDDLFKPISGADRARFKTNRKMAYQLRIGKKIEMEHTDYPFIAERIAMHHILEIPDYYSKLKKMEGKKDGKEEGQGQSKVRYEEA
jgi:hypothetical protein